MPALPWRRRDAATSAVMWLLLAQLVMFTGIAAVFPVAPLYVRAHGGNAVAAALFIAGPLVANTVVQVPAGWLVDRIGRRPLLIGARVGYAVLAFALFADVGPLWFLALLRTGQGVCGGAYIPALLAAITDLTPPERRSERFSQLQAAELVGLLIGPLFGGAIAVWRDSGIFLVAGSAVMLGLLPMSRVPETHGRRQRAAADTPPGWWRVRGILVAAAGLCALGMVFSMYDVVWPQYLAARGINTVLIGLSISLFALPMLALATPGGRLADRSNRRVILGLAFSGAAACCITYPGLHTFAIILAVGIAEACCIVLVEPTLYASIGDAAPVSARGRAMGIGGFLQFGGSAAGAAVLGSLYGLREGIPFWAGGGAMIAAGMLCAAILPARRPRARPSATQDAEAAGLVVGALQDGDDAGRAHVDRPLLAGKLDELVDAAGDVHRGDGVLDAELDGDVAAVGEA